MDHHRCSGVAALLIAVAAYMIFGGKKEAPAAAPAPGVTVIVPGRTTVTGMIGATGTLRRQRELPVGVVGEGGMVQNVLVEPGHWVAAGQTLAVIDRSVQAQEANSHAAPIRVAQADARLAQSTRPRQALVDRGFISKADVDRKTATRDAANARVAVARAQFGQARAQIGRLNIRSPRRRSGARTARLSPARSSARQRRAVPHRQGRRTGNARPPDRARPRPPQGGDPARVTPISTTRSFTGTSGRSRR